MTTFGDWNDTPEQKGSLSLSLSLIYIYIYIYISNRETSFGFLAAGGRNKQAGNIILAAGKNISPPPSSCGGAVHRFLYKLFTAMVGASLVRHILAFSTKIA